MSLLDYLRRDAFSLENPSTDLIAAINAGSDLGAQEVTGVRVNEETALKVSAVFACTRLLSTSVASLPIHLYRRTRDGDREVVDWEDWRMPLVAKDGRPNEVQTGFDMWELVMAHLCTWGNAYVRRERNGAGREVALWPLMPGDVEPVRKEGTREHAYRCWLDGTEVLLLPDEVLHFRAFGPSPWRGMSPVRAAAVAIGIARAAEEYGGRFFAQSGQPGGLIQVPKTLSDRAYSRLRRRWEAMHQGTRRAHMLAILEEGAQWQSIGLPPGDLQFLQTREFQLEEVCRIFGVPPFMVGALEKQTSWGTGVEQQQIGFTVFHLRGWLERLEVRLTTDLFAPPRGTPGPPPVFPEFSVEGLLRGDFKSRMEGYQIGLNTGILTWAEVRRKENLPVRPGDENHMVPLNMQLIGPDGKAIVPTQPTPIPPGTAPGEEAPTDEEGEEDAVP